MNTTPDTTASSGASSNPVVPNSPPSTVPVIVQVSANAAPESRLTKGNRAAKVAPASSDAPVTTRLSAPFSPDVELSPNLAGMTPLQIAMAFAGVPAEEQTPKAAEPKTGNLTTESDDDDAQGDDDDIDTDGAHEGQQTEGDDEDGDEAAEQEEESPKTAAEHPLNGIVKAMTDKGLGKLAARVTKVFTENGELKAAALQAKQAPPVVLKADGSEALPFAQAKTAEQVEVMAKSTAAEVRTYLRWLNRHPDGGVYAEGTKQEIELNARQVENDLTYWEQFVDELPAHVSGRKAWLAKYDETVKSLEVPVDELIQPKVETRESKLLRTVPELARDAEFALFLADAQAGRELRAKKAAGQVPVYVDAAKAKAKQQAAAGEGSREAAGKGRAVTAAPSTNGAAKSTSTLESLRTLVESGGPGSRAAADKLAMMMAA